MPNLPSTVSVLPLTSTSPALRIGALGLLALLAVAILAVFAGNGTAHASTATDRAALVTLYNATDGANWTNNTNWLSNEPLSEWYGVSTDADSRVTGLFLLGNNLSGTIPSDLGDLTQLRDLFLEYNDLSGSIPVELSNLSNLRTLRLDKNELTGMMPLSVGSLASLQDVRVGNNALEGCLHPSYTSVVASALRSAGISACGADEVVLIDLYHAADGENWATSTNWLSSKSLSEWHGVTTNADGRVTSLDLDDNNLSGSILAKLGSLSSLQTLDLSSN